MNNYQRCEKNEELLERIYDNVRFLMEWNGITSTELEKGVGVGYNTFNKFKYEKHIHFGSQSDKTGVLMDYDMRITFLAEIAKYFNIRLDDLICRNAEELKELMLKRKIVALKKELRALEEEN